MYLLKLFIFCLLLHTCAKVADATGFVVNTNRVRRSADKVQVSPFNVTPGLDVGHISKAYLNDSRQNINIHWEGVGSDVIVAVTFDGTSSRVYFSYNYGKTFEEKGVKHMKRLDGSGALIENFIHSTISGHYHFLDLRHNLSFTTQTSGRSDDWSRVLLPFSPKHVSFNPRLDSYLVGHDGSRRFDTLYESTDSGQTWFVVMDNVIEYYWGSAPYDSLHTLYVVKRAADGSASLVRILAHGSARGSPQLLLQHVLDVKVTQQYIFATKREGSQTNLYVSYQRKPFEKARFPFEDIRQSILPLESESQVFAAVRYNFSCTTLFVSEAEGVRFTLSLPNIVSFSKHLTDGSYRLMQVDLTPIAGMRGMFLANALLPNTTLTSGWRNYTSIITVDNGGAWFPLNAPRNASLSNCMRCQLHLQSTVMNSIWKDRLHQPLMSRASAPGILITSGSYGVHTPSPYDTKDLLISTDAGFTWRNSLMDDYFHNFGDHGGVIVACSWGLTDRLYYSLDGGVTWHSQRFAARALRVYGLLTEPGEASATFSVFASDPSLDSHSWIIIQVDLRPAFARNCTASDYRMWNPLEDVHWLLSPAFLQWQRCLLGRRLRVQRRAPATPCYTGPDFRRKTITLPCACSRADFECDTGYELSYMLLGGLPRCAAINGARPPLQHCHPELSYYNKTRGYRKISGDQCTGGTEYRYLPEQVPCSQTDSAESVLLWGNSGLRSISVASGSVHTLLSGSVRAADYDINADCLYSASSSGLTRTCYKSTQRETLRAEPDVAGVAFDWSSAHVYWSEPNLLHMALADGQWRRSLLNESLGAQLSLDPLHGFLYYAKESGINRVRLDGKNIGASPTQVVIKCDRRPVFDLDRSRQILFWSLPESNTIQAFNLTNNRSETFSITNTPSSIVVFKDLLLYYSSRQGAIYSLDKYSGRGEQELVAHLFGFSSMRAVEALQQQGHSGCTEQNGKCPFLCAPSPLSRTERLAQQVTCLCPDSLSQFTTQHGEHEHCECPQGTKLNATLEECVEIGNTTCPPRFRACTDGSCIFARWFCDGDRDCRDGSDEQGCTEATCSSGHFQCVKSRRCIPDLWRCDFEADCSDSSDEQHCENVSCDAMHFRCDSGQCVPTDYLCDGEDDCFDGSDENNCSVTLPPNHCDSNGYQCSSGFCISRSQVCNGVPNCPDGADEKQNCSKHGSCGSRFDCGLYAGCVDQSLRCNGLIDCTNGADEENCSTTSLSTAAPHGCGWFDMPCSGESLLGPSRQGPCYSFVSMCDGVWDCPNGEDEQFCHYQSSTLTTSPAPSTNSGCSGGFRCWQSAGQPCIFRRWVCDGGRDCEQGEDEIGCEHVTPAPCAHNYFRCRSSVGCIRPAYVCDGKEDCADASDELGCAFTSLAPPSPKRRPYAVCLEGEQLCLDLFQCVLKNDFCNGVYQCRDRSDETSCARVGSAVSSLWTSAVNSTTALLHWSRPIQAPRGRWEYTVNLRETADGKSHNKSAVNDTSLLLTSLLPYTRYTVAVYLRDSQTNALFAPVRYLQFLTAEAAPSAPQVLQVRPCSDDTCSVQLSWRRPAHPNGKIRYYMVYYSSSKWEPGRSVRVSPAVSGTEPERHATLVLNTRLTYTFTVSAVTSSEGPRSDPITQNLTEDFIDLPVTELKATSATGTSLHLQWLPIGGQYKNISYSVRLVSGGTVVVDTHTTETEVKVIDLEPGLRYEVLVCAQNQYGRGPVSTLFVRTTGEAASAVSISSVKAVDARAVRVSWKESKKQAKDARYDLFYGPWSGTGSPADWERFAAHKLPGQTCCSAELSALSLCQRYWVGVRMSQPKLSAMSGLVSFATGPNETAAPVLTDVTTSGRSILVTFDAACPSAASLFNMSYVVRAEALRYGGPPFSLTTVLLGSPPLSTHTRVPPPSSSRRMHVTLQHALPGAAYRVTVRVHAPASIWSRPKLVQVAPLPAPEDVQFSPLPAQRAVVLMWSLPQPPYASLPLVVWRGGARCADLKVVLHLAAGSTNATLHSLQPDTVYCAAVSIDRNSTDEYYGALSDTIAVDAGRATKPNSGQVVLPKSHLAAIVTPVVLIVLVLGITLAVYIIRHRRLQQSFLLFANSRYNVSSGASAFFTDDADDSPNIQGFSDDEPLVLA